ncbi:MAG: hypothetical protein FWF80_06660 [Defluviitaleaceae bacterium]|nr:hypothetical protein [Defluviitaleaceae bacterium]
MKNLIFADFLKLRRSFGYKGLILALFIFGVVSWYIPLIVYESTAITGLHFLRSAVVDFQLISSFIAIYAGIFISSEFVNRTFGMAVSTGNKRFPVFFSKVIVFLIGSLPMVVSLAAPMVLLTSIMNGFAPQPENPYIHIIHGPDGASNIIRSRSFYL